MQEAGVPSLIREDPTRLRAAQAMHHQLLKPERPRARAPQQGKPSQRAAQALHPESGPHSPQLEESTRNTKDPAEPKIK